MNLVFGSLSSFIMAFFVFSVMSEYSLDEPGFPPPVPPVPPSSSESSVETPVDGRRKCSSCKKSVDRHTFCVYCKGFNCDILIVARSAWSGQWMISLNMRKSQFPKIQGVVF